MMATVRTTVTLDEDVIRAVKVKAARSGKSDSEVIEESLRRDLGFDALDELWSRVEPGPELEGMEFANAELHAMREDHPRP